jgi:phosphate transport system substrate-binding protein
MPLSGHHIRALVWLAVTLLAGCASARSAPGPDNFAPSLSIAADPASARLAEGLLNAYESLHPQATLSLTPLNRENALNAVESGEVDAALLLHPPQDGGWFYTPVGRELIAIIAHPGVPAEGVNRRDIRALYSGQITAWSGENGETQPVQLVILERGESTALAFDALVLHGQEPASSARVAPDVDYVVGLVESTPGGLGIAPLNAVDGEVKTLAYEDVEPTPDNARDHRYTLVTDVVFVALREPTGAAKSFLDWVLSEEGQAVVRHHMLGFDE